MQELVYEVAFLSDIVLPATSNTEGNIQQLDFIAGSNFLGMVAREYDAFEDSFHMFHSGKVRFGDATLLYNGKPTYKMPLSYFFDKGKEEVLYNHHLIKDFTDFMQLKQKRNGYITKDLESVFIDYNYTQKSAYDKTNRKSLDSSMFGYSAMKKGLKWQFSIQIDTIGNNDLKLLKETIVGQKRLGKSKSAQYGLVDIRFIKEQKRDAQSIDTLNEVTLYAKSRIALVDESGNPTYDLKYLCDGLEYENENENGNIVSKIDYPKCQIKTSTFTPYNGAMQTKTYERICINKGSVIILNDVTQEQLDEIKRGVGLYLAEGFGEILINPSFLMERDGFNLIKEEKRVDTETREIKNSLGKFLRQREDAKQKKLTILNDVDDFIINNKSLYKNIKPSQWGKIRSICTSEVDGFKEEIEDYISHGDKKWEKKQIKRLLEVSDDLEFIKLLSIQMPKQKNTKKEQKDEN